MDAPVLSPAALALFRRHVEALGELDVAEADRGPYRELERAGLVLLGRPFVGVPRYHLTRAGYDLRVELYGCARESA
ncbi:MAG: hypothetical protein U0800_23990 [Isosphaeraceae bacterium]